MGLFVKHFFAGVLPNTRNNTDLTLIFFIFIKKLKL